MFDEHPLDASAPTGDRSYPAGIRRRHVLKVLAGLGVGSGVFSRALAAQAEGRNPITLEAIKEAEWIAGLELTETEREMMRDGLNRSARGYARLRAISIDNGVPPALDFHPDQDGSGRDETAERKAKFDGFGTGAVRGSDDDVAFASIRTLSDLLYTRRISSVELTRLYLDRLRRSDPTLRCVINYTEQSAMKQAEQADREIASGSLRGPLHGIPWGAKDILAFPGYPTTWGAKPYEAQVRDDKATVISKLEDAGAVLIAKLSVGALAMGDVWFGGTTKNPWNPERGSSGSSAGPAAATVAGGVGFSIGTETLGSIVSPCTRCGATGLRPTFGRVSRYGCMALSWSMNKIGPIGRCADDCAFVFDAIRGADRGDPSSVNRPFTWPAKSDVRKLRVGYVASMFDEDRTSRIENPERKARVAESQSFDRRVLETLRGLGIKLIPMELPDEYPTGPLRTILNAEAGAAFDELTRSGRDDELTRQGRGAWPNAFRQSQFIPAVEYIRANRIRTLLMREMAKVMQKIDVYVCPSFGGSNLLLTNLTGHPALVLPSGYREGSGAPTSITLTGRLYGESELLAVGYAYQQATDYHTKRPPMDRILNRAEKDS